MSEITMAQAREMNCMWAERQGVTCWPLDEALAEVEPGTKLYAATLPAKPTLVALRDDLREQIVEMAQEGDGLWGFLAIFNNEELESTVIEEADNETKAKLDKALENVCAHLLGYWDHQEQARYASDEYVVVP